MLAGLDAVTVEDVERVAAEILGGDLRLALIGLFDEPESFERTHCCLSSAYPGFRIRPYFGDGRRK